MTAPPNKSSSDPHRDDPSLGYRGKFIVRTCGTTLLTVCCLMVVLGVTVWNEELQGPLFMLYWSWCFLVSLGAIFAALIDLLFIRRATREKRRQLLHEQILGEKRR